MPTRLKNHGGQWQARVYANGRQVATKLFPPGRKNGPEWRAAKEWEEETRQAVMAGIKTSSDSESFRQWCVNYLEYAGRVMAEKTVKEKAMVLADFADHCIARGVNNLDQISVQVVHVFLTAIFDARGGHVANKYRKHLCAAWNWGLKTLEGFPAKLSPFYKVSPFKVAHGQRYVPPEEDITAVLSQLGTQDAVLLLAYIQTGARRGELFRLTWDDVDLDPRHPQIRLTDRKAGGGGWRERWQGIGVDLAAAFHARPVRKGGRQTLRLSCLAA